MSDAAFEAWWATWVADHAAARANYTWQSDGGEYPPTSTDAKEMARIGWDARKQHSTEDSANG